MAYTPLGRDQDTLYDAGQGFRDFELEPLELSQARLPSNASTKTNILETDNDERPLLLKPSEGSVLDEIPANDEKTLEGSSVVSKEKKRKLQGWHFGVAAAMIATGTVLLANFAFLVIAVAVHDTKGGIGTLLEGSCKRVNSLATWAHLLINVLSTMLLSASNYTMQCLYAPTRADINNAHHCGRWLDIGIPGIRNLFRISYFRSSLWLVLAFSSVPIHLLYNSVIFKSTDANTYGVLLAKQDFLTRGTHANSTRLVHKDYDPDIYSVTTSTPEAKYFYHLFAKDHAWQDRSRFERLTNKECMEAYSNETISGRDHVIAITLNQTAQPNATALYFTEAAYFIINGMVPTVVNKHNWMCYDNPPQISESCPQSELLSHPSNWTFLENKIDHCISHIQKERCKLQFSSQVLAVVILCNAAKTIAMCLTFLKQKEATLVTIGDAMTSFLNDPDETTKGMCLKGRSGIRNSTFCRRKHGQRSPLTTSQPAKNHAPRTRRWKNAITKLRWAAIVVLCGVALGVAIDLLNVGLNHVLEVSNISAFSLGLGAITTQSMLDISFPSLLLAVLLSNLPQAILSILYLMYNSLFTSMCLANEWGKFSNTRQPLRVTTPHGQQKSTYFLQLPYSYAIPLLTASTILHWLVSQSLFFARIEAYTDGVLIPDSETSQIGYSCKAILCAIILGGVMLLVAIGIGFRKLPSDMPVAGSCSAAIAAACHRPKDDPDAAYLPVKWGEVNADALDEIGHCCFTSHEVRKPVPGKQYA